MPTTITKSIGTATRDYSTVQAWEDAMPASLVTADEYWVGECYNDSEFVPAGTVVTFAGVVTDATRSIKLTAAAGQSFQDDAGKATNPLRYDVAQGVGFRTGTFASGVIIVSTSGYYEFSRLQLKNTASYGNGCVNVTIVTYGQVLLDSLLMEEDKPSGGGAVAVLPGVGIARNCIAIKRVSGVGDGITHSFTGAASGSFGCTVVRPNGRTIAGSGFASASLGGSPVLKNCAVFGFTDFADSASFGGDYNQSDDATNIPGANSNGTRTYANQFEDYENASSDFRAKSTGDLKNGTPDATNTPDDIIGTTRDATTPWVGCWEVPGAAASNSFPLEGALAGPFGGALS